MPRILCALALGLATSAHAELSESDIKKMEPLPGRDTAVPFRPPWCDAAEKKRPGSYTPAGIGRTAGNLIEGGRADVATVAEIAAVLCLDPDDAGVQKQAGYVIQAWINRLGTSQRDAVTSLGARADAERWNQMRGAHCARFAVDAEAGDETQAVAKAYRAIFGCTPAEPMPAWQARSRVDVAWFLDRDADPPSELLRAYLVVSHFNPDAMVPDSSEMLRNIIVLGHDARTLNPGRLTQELEASDWNEFGKQVARETMARALADARDLEAFVAGLSKDPDMKRILVDVPEKAWAEWQALRRRESALFDDVEAFEKLAESPRRSAVKGCGAKLRPHVAKSLRKKQIPDVKAAEALLLGDPAASQALERYVLCEAMAGDSSYASALGDVVNRSRGHRGPRMAAHLAAIGTLSDIIADRPKFPLDARYMRPIGVNPYPQRIARAIDPKVLLVGETGGVVGATKKVAEGVMVTFKKETWTHNDYDCRSTGRIARVLTDGRIEMEQVCKKVGRTTETVTPKPVVIPEALAGGVAPGRFLVSDPDRNRRVQPDVYVAVPLAVYESKEQKRVVAVWGFEL